MSDSAQAPPSLGAILGHDRAVATLRAAFSAQRIHHAWIFSGPAGVGKRTTAAAFAGMLLDPTTAPNLAGDLEPDPDSPVQNLIATGSHPDLHIITKELAAVSDFAHLRSRKQLNIPLDLLRERILGGWVQETFLESRISKAPMMGHAKVFIIDEAEALDQYGQNAILKVLEEPPQKTYIILVTANEHRLLPTIRSRCQRTVFAPLDDRAMDQWLKRSGIEAPKEELSWLKQFAAGAPGVALLAHTTGLHNWAKTLDPMLDMAESGRAPPSLGSTMSGLVEQWAESWVKEHKNASKESANNAAARHLFAFLTARARRRLREAHNDPEEMDRALRTIDLVSTTERYIGANVNLGLSMENLAAQLNA